MARSILPSRALASLAIALLALATPRAARAQDAGLVCDDTLVARGPAQVTPLSGASGVTIDAPLTLRYSHGYFDPLTGPGDAPETLVRVGLCPPGTAVGCGQTACDPDTATFVPGRVQVVGDQLFFVPDGGWQPSATYVGHASGVDVSIDFGFCTGRLADSGPPQLGGFVGHDAARTGPSCRLPSGGRRVGLRVRPATDDGPPGSIQYVLFLTRGTGVVAPEERDRLSNFATDEITMTLLLTDTESSTPVCVRAVAVDGVGNVSQPTPEECVDPLDSIAFQPLTCAVSAAPGAPSRSAGAPLVALVGALGVGATFLARRRRGR